MTHFNLSMLLICCALAACLLLALGFQLGGAESPRQNSVVLLLKETQRAEALDDLDQRTRESFTTMRGIVRKLIDGEMPLEEALDSYAEVYEQLYFVQGWRAEGRRKPLSREGAFEQVLGDIQDELKGNPARAREVKERVQKEWDSLHARPLALLGQEASQGRPGA
jgi:hypothetical protein